MCIFTICPVKYVFSCRSVDLIFCLYFLSNSDGLSLVDILDSYGRQMPADTKKALDRACVVSNLDASFGKGQ